jgi:hypothetical protein
MAYTTINKSTDYFNTKTWTGTGSSNALTGVGFQPDWVWIKRRDQTAWHYLTDAVRGVTKTIYSNDTAAQATQSNGLTAFGSDGFTVGSQGDINESGGTYVGWNWKANGAGSSNTDGSINSTVSVNTTSGFSIVKYTGNSGGNGYSATIGHGLGVAPKLIFVKCITHSAEWNVYANDATDFLILNESNATSDDDTRWYDTAPTNSVFTVGTNSNVNNVGRDYIAYCFAEKTGYSKFGTYTGNGNADGSVIYTGFKPAFYIIKRLDTTGSWIIKDTKRPGYNVNGTYLVADTNIAEATGSGNLATDEYSNGFKMRGTSAAINENGGTYTYLAFGQTLVGSNNIPATAR